MMTQSLITQLIVNSLRPINKHDEDDDNHNGVYCGNSGDNHNNNENDADNDRRVTMSAQMIVVR